MSAPGSARVDTKTRSRWQHERQHIEVLAVVVGVVSILPAKLSTTTGCSVSISVSDVIFFDNHQLQRRRHYCVRDRKDFVIVPQCRMFSFSTKFLRHFHLWMMDSLRDADNTPDDAPNNKPCCPVGFEGIVMINVDDAEDNFLCTFCLLLYLKYKKAERI
jgi:hypothetical protein